MKKVLAILSIVFILFSFTVPIFADSSDPAVLIYMSSGTISTSFGNMSRYVNNVLKVFSSSVIFSYVNTYAYSLYLNGSFYSHIDLTSDFELSLNPGDVIYICQYDVDVFTSSIPFSSFTFLSAFYDLSNLNISWIPKIRDISSLFIPQGYYSLPSGIVYVDYSILDWNLNYYPYQTINSFYSPFIDFHKNILSHSFDYVSNLTSTYSGIFIFVCFILFICFMIFIVVLVIRRCRNI